MIDITGMGQLLGKGPDTPLVANYGQHQIVERFNLMTFFPVARSVSPSKPPVAGLSCGATDRNRQPELGRVGFEVEQRGLR